MNIFTPLLLSTININWEILLANGPTILFFTFLGLVVYGMIFGFILSLTNMIFDAVYWTPLEIFFKINGIIITIALILWGIISWVSWSNKTLAKPENQNKPIIEHIVEK